MSGYCVPVVVPAVHLNNRTVGFNNYYYFFYNIIIIIKEHERNVLIFYYILPIVLSMHVRSVPNECTCTKQARQ